MLVGADKKHTLVLDLPVGEHLYKFKVDGEWKVDFGGKIGVDEKGDIANSLTIE